MRQNGTKCGSLSGLGPEHYGNHDCCISYLSKTTRPSSGCWSILGLLVVICHLESIQQPKHSNSSDEAAYYDIRWWRREKKECCRKMIWSKKKLTYYALQPSTTRMHRSTRMLKQPDTAPQGEEEDNESEVQDHVNREYAACSLD